MAYNVWAILVLLQFSLVLISGAIEEESTSNWETKRNGNPKQVVIKSIKSENGDIFDCIDIMSQPTFQDPRFTNHTIQMAPSLYPNFMNRKSNYSNAEINTVSCPLGTIPIWRNHMNSTQFYSNVPKFGQKSQRFPGSYLASVSRPGKNYGTSASLIVYEPNVDQDFDGHSGSAAYIANYGKNPLDDIDSMQAGWTVWPKHAGDKKTRFFIRWQNAKQRSIVCINLSCSGFVQTSSTIPLGVPLQPISVYGGPQYHITIHIFKDFKTGNWWLAYGNDKHLIGYWIKSVFTYMDNGAKLVSWGGEVLVVTRHTRSPPMGSGHFPSEGFGKAAAVLEASIVDENNNHITPNRNECYRQVYAPNCYNVDKFASGQNGIEFYFGGPGGCQE